MKMTIFGLCIAVLFFSTQNLRAGEADVIDVKANKVSAHTYTFKVTVRHTDTGWDHYADKWEILDPGGKVLGTRVLLHPHEDEQPFTRSLTGVHVPSSVKEVTVRTHDKAHGWGGKTMTVKLP